jgi:hypothetical protein
MSVLNLFLPGTFFPSAGVVDGDGLTEDQGRDDAPIDVSDMSVSVILTSWFSV